MKPKLIVLAGPDGTGKSTQTKLLASKYQAQIVVQPSERNLVGYIRNEVKNNKRHSPEFRQALHTISHLVDIEILDGSKNIVMDRSFVCAYVYGSVTGMHVEDNELLLKIHQDTHKAALEKYDIYLVLLDAEQKHKPGDTDEFEKTFKWGLLRDTYLQVFAGVKNDDKFLMCPHEEITYIKVGNGKSIGEVTKEIVSFIGGDATC